MTSPDPLPPPPSAAPSDGSRLRPSAFHEALCRALQKNEPGLWAWFASDDYGKKYADLVKLELLRGTYRLPRESHESLYALVTDVARALEIEVPLTLYQAQSDGVLNAGLAFVPGEAHLVLRGPVLQTLTDAELRALFGHELAHHRLWTTDGGKFHIANALIEHIASQPSCAPSHIQSALRFRRWTELYADRGALLACEDLHAAIACLVKMTTGLQQVAPDAYLAQSEEVIGSTTGGSEGLTHPESFLRVFALKIWHHGADESRLQALVDGPFELERLDLVQQDDLTAQTLRFLSVVLEPAWMRTDATLTHARRFFPEESFARSEPLESLPQGGPSLSEYFAYLLLDFALADPDLEDQSLAHAAHLAQRFGLDEVFSKLARKELRLSVAKYAELEKIGAELASGKVTP